MMKNTAFRALLVLLLLFAFSPQAAHAITPPSHESVHHQKTAKRPFVAVAELGQQIQALVTGGEEGAEIEPQETFGTRALGLVLTFIDVIRQEYDRFVGNLTAYPEFSAWFVKQVTDPVLIERWQAISERLLYVVGGAFFAGLFADLLLLSARMRLRRRQPKSLAARFGTLISWLLISLIPVIVFLGTALALMDQSQQVKVVRYVVMTVVYGMAVLQLIRLITRFLLAPKAPHLRLVPLSDHQSRLLQGWFNAFSLVMVFSYFSVDVAQLMRVPASTIAAFSSLAGFIIVAMALALIVRIRPVISTFLRGELSAAQQGLTLWQALRLWLARTWHVLAIAYLVIGYIFTMLRSEGGFAIMQRGTIVTILTLFAVHSGLHFISRMGLRREHESGGKASGILSPILRMLGNIGIWGLGVAGISAAWGADIEALFLSPWGQRVMGSAFTITATLVIVAIIYDYLQHVIEKRLHQKDVEGNVVEANARARTLLPMLRNAAIIVLGIVVSMVTLSELGVNIGPLLAGAGVIGVAVGFGSQTLVKDFLTGLFIILENTIAVGDVVKIGDNSGVVESITIRTVRLRDVNGALHVLPFSEISRFINQTKTFSYAVTDVGVSYNSDLRAVMKVMGNIGAEMVEDPAWRDIIIDGAEVLGVETLGDSSITIRCRIKTKPGRQWDVKREFLLRVKERFDLEKIEIPFPIVTHIHKKSGESEAFRESDSPAFVDS